MAFNVTVTPIVQEVEVNASVTPYDVDISVIDGQDLTLTTLGTSGVATYNPFTGLLNIPNYSTDLSGVVPIGRTLTINGTTFDLSANRTWVVGDLRSDQSYSNPTWLTALAWSKITGTPTTLAGYGITDAVPSSRQLTINGVAFDLSANRTWTIPTHDAVTIGTANGLSLAGQVLSLGLASAGVTGALSGTDWTTFNNKVSNNLYTANGTLAGARVVTLGGFDLDFAGTTTTRFFANGRVAIGTTTDAGFRLDVNGTARVQGQITATSAELGSGQLALSVNQILGFNGVRLRGGASSIGGTSVGTLANIQPNIQLFVLGYGTTTATSSLVVRNSANTNMFIVRDNGGILINTTTDVASAIVNIESTTQGFLPPRMTTAQRDAIVSPAAGLVIYNTSTNTHQGYNGTTWNNFY